jgi:hypothetical protein
MRYSQLALTVAVCLASPSIAEEPRTSLGVLTCTLAKVTDDRTSGMTCGFKPLEGGAAEEKYDGSVHGLAQVAVGKQVLVWTVIGPANTKLSAGMLAQRYSKSKGPGQSSSWVGETNKAIVLKFETHEGGEIGNAIADLELKLSGTAA